MGSAPPPLEDAPAVGPNSAPPPLEGAPPPSEIASDSSPAGEPIAEAPGALLRSSTRRGWVVP
jgi:hypothetical protein